jgi:hypothetical protein
VVVSPNVGNGDVIVNATGGIAINSDATTPVTGAATGFVAVTCTTLDVDTTADLLLTAGDEMVLAAATDVQITSPLRVINTITLEAILNTATTGADNLTIGNVSVVRFSGPPNPLTGMIPVYAGQVVLMVNTHASADMGIFNESLSSTSTHRFAGPGTSRTVRPGEMALAWYDSTTGRWRVLCRDDGDL